MFSVQALCDGPDVERQLVQFKNMKLLPWMIEIDHKADNATVLDAWKAAGTQKSWENCEQYKDIQNAKRVCMGLWLEYTLRP